MNAKGYLSGSISILALITTILASCAKPPTEKISSIQTALAECETIGASIFAPDEYQRINQKMAELNSLMEAKKFRKATSLADTIIADIPSLKDLSETNGKQAAQEIMTASYEQLGSLKALLTEENVKLLDTEAAKYQQQCGDMEATLMNLQGALDNGNALEVYNNSAMTGKLSASVQACNAEIAVAAEKAAAAKKPVRKKKK